MLRYITPLILLVLIGCNSKTETKKTCFGGKIINPKSNFIILTDHQKFADTIPLRTDNTFIKCYPKFNEGLYKFEHGPEYQYVYIEPKDSVIIRLNTWDFDESLVFNGDNAHKNNKLIDVFLQNEDENPNYYKYAALDSKSYKAKTDSILNLKKNQLEAFKSQYPETSERFMDLLNIALTYQTYLHTEEYGINRCLSDFPKETTAGFYNHRNNTTRSIDTLMFFYPYNHYVINSLYRDAYEKGLKNNHENLTLELLHGIDTNIKNEKVKNRLLFNITVKHFFSETCNTNSQKTLYTFFKLSSSNNDKKEIQRLINDTKELKKGDKLPSFKLIDPTGEVYDVSKTIKGKNSFIYFKNHKFTSDEYVSSRINLLMKQNPTINFLIVNSCSHEGCYTKNIDIKNQVRLTQNSDAKHFLSSGFSRLVLVDKNGVIQNAFSSLSTDDLSHQIADLEK